MPISTASDALLGEFRAKLFTAMRAVGSILVAEFAVWAIAMRAPDFGPNWRTARQTLEFEHAKSGMHAFEFRGRFIIKVNEFWDAAFALRTQDTASRFGITERFNFFAV